MQWRCPHCGVALSLPENTVTSGWSFTRCYKCGGFGLVRKAEISVIKIDQVPAGEHVLLPEPPLSQSAVVKTTQRILAKNPPAPISHRKPDQVTMTYEH